MKKLVNSRWGLCLGVALVIGVAATASVRAQTDDENDESYIEDDFEHSRIYQNSLQRDTLQQGPLNSGSFPQSFSQQGFSQQSFAQPSDLQQSLFRQQSFPSGFTPRDPFRSPGPYMGPRDPLSQNSFQQRWKPLSFATDLHRLKPTVQPIVSSLTGNLTRSNVQARDQQSFDILTPPLDLPESGRRETDPTASYSRGYSASAPRSTPPVPPVVSTPATNPANPVTARPRRAPSAIRPPSTEPYPTKQSPGRLTFSVHPADTRILVNDQILGTGESLSSATGPEILKPGVYAIEAEHNRYETERLMFSLTSDESLHVVIDLTAPDAERGRVDKVY